jgi:hypothetical protein
VLRRSFRFGLTVGILLGLAFALVKVLGGRRTSEPEPAPLPAPPWPRLEPAPDVVAAPATTDLQPDPEAPAPRSRPAAGKKAPAKSAAPAASRAWVEPSGDICPTSHPVKGKLSSKIFHLPGMLNYDRTKPDRCYRDGDSAEADGLRPAKR